MLDREITWTHVEVVRGSRREISVHGLRTSAAKMRLTDQQRQALVDIDKGFEAIEKGIGYAMLGIKSFNPHRSRGGALGEDVIDRMRRYAGRLHEWQFWLADNGKIRWGHAVEAINQRGHTARSFAELSGFHHDTISDWYKSGLDSYADLHYK